jgi:hypothetical protein
MTEYAREMVGGVVVAVVLAAIVGGVAIYSFPSSPGSSTASNTTTVSSFFSSTTVYSISSSVTSATSPCGSPGVYCGRFEITSGSLFVNKSEATLQVTLLEVGNMYIGSATVYINGTVIGVPPASEYEPPGNIPLNVQPGQQAVLVLTISNSTISVQVGRTYPVMVYGWLGPPGERAGSGGGEYINVTATQ